MHVVSRVRQASWRRPPFLSEEVGIAYLVKVEGDLDSG